MERRLSRAGRDVKLVVLGLLLGIGLTPHADDKPRLSFEPVAPKVTADLGYADCRATPSPDGQWYQKDQDGTGRYKAGCGTFGFSAALNDDWTVGIHYVSLGRNRVDALAIAFPGDDRANMTAAIDPLRSACGATFTEGCKYQWHTGSFTRGLNFSLARRLFDFGPVRFDGKVGLYAHTLSSDAVVEPLGCRDNCPWRVLVDQSHNSIKPMWGAQVKWKYLFASWEFYEGIGAHTPVTANIKGRTEVKTIGVSIPL